MNPAGAADTTGQTGTSPLRASLNGAESRGFVQQAWPIALGVLVAAATVFGLRDGRDVAAVVAASGLVYLAAASTGRPMIAWPAFGVTLVLITVDKLTGLDALPWILVLAVVLLVVGLAGGRTRPWWAMPLQAIAMIALGAIAVIAIRLDATTGGLLVAAALFAHAAWDVVHHRTRHVVDRRLAVFCGVLDMIVASFLIVIAVTA